MTNKFVHALQKEIKDLQIPALGENYISHVVYEPEGFYGINRYSCTVEFNSAMTRDIIYDALKRHHYAKLQEQRQKLKDKATRGGSLKEHDYEYIPPKMPVAVSFNVPKGILIKDNIVTAFGHVSYKKDENTIVTAVPRVLWKYLESIFKYEMKSLIRSHKSLPHFLHHRVDKRKQDVVVHLDCDAEVHHQDVFHDILSIINGVEMKLESNQLGNLSLGSRPFKDFIMKVVAKSKEEGCRVVLWRDTNTKSIRMYGTMHDIKIASKHFYEFAKDIFSGKLYGAPTSDVVVDDLPRFEDEELEYDEEKVVDIMISRGLFSILMSKYEGMGNIRRIVLGSEDSLSRLVLCNDNVCIKGSKYSESPFLCLKFTGSLLEYDALCKLLQNCNVRRPEVDTQVKSKKAQPLCKICFCADDTDFISLTYCGCEYHTSCFEEAVDFYLSDLNSHMAKGMSCLTCNKPIYIGDIMKYADADSQRMKKLLKCSLSNYEGGCRLMLGADNKHCTATVQEKQWISCPNGCGAIYPICDENDKFSSIVCTCCSFKFCRCCQMKSHNFGKQ